MEGRRGAGRRGQGDDLDFGVAQDRREEAVVGPDEPVAVGPQREGRAGGADPGIHHREVHRGGRESVPGATEQIGARPDVAGGNGVGDVDQHRRGQRPSRTPLISAT